MEIALPYGRDENECHGRTFLMATELKVPSPVIVGCSELLLLDKSGEASHQLQFKASPTCALSDETKTRTQPVARVEADPVSSCAAEMAHDFNNLVSIILGYCSELIHDESLSDEHRAVSIEIEKAAERTSRLIMQFLAIAKNSRNSLCFQECDSQDC